ncbi:MAG: tetratricopeptide repeat protein [Anaeromyxobacter sp.]
MRLPRLALLALALAAAPALAAAEGPVPAGPPRQDLVPVARAMTAIDGADRRGDVADERRRWSEAAARAPIDAPAAFLAVYAQPAGEARWGAFKALAKKFPQSALPHVGMALVYVDWNVIDQAEQAVARALSVEPDCWLALYARARAHERKERDEQAASDYRAVLAADAANPDAHLGLARLARRAGDVEGAKREAEAALAGDARYVPSLELLGELALAAGEDREAISLWARAVEASPSDRRARATLAGLYVKAGDPANAKEQWKAAVALREDPQGLEALADTARAAADVETEKKALERLGALDPQTPRWRRLAELRIDAQEWDLAEKALKRALAVDPKDGAAQLGLGKVHLARGETLEAIESLRAAGPAAKPELTKVEERVNLKRLKKSDVNALQKAVSGLVDRTFRARLAEAPALNGVLKVRVTVDSSGSATLVEVLEDSMHDGDVRASAYWNLRDATYPAGRPGRYSFTFNFTNPGA